MLLPLIHVYRWYYYWLHIIFKCIFETHSRMLTH